VVEESTEEIVGWEAESTLQGGGEHHNLICIGCGEVFTGGRTPLQYSTIWEKMICIELANLTFICNGRLEQMRMQGDHGWDDDSLRQEIKVSEETDIAKKMMRKGGK
jgi:hypothetical protein